MSEAEFRLAYHGEAVANGEMEVTDLAPALLAMAQVLKAAGRVVDGDSADVSVRVKSTSHGCFEVFMTLSMDDVRTAWSLWKSPDVQGAASLLSLLGFTGAGAAMGAVKLIRTMKGRQPERIAAAEPGLVSVEINGDVIIVPDMVARLAFDSGVRSALEKVVAEPLEKDGIDGVSLGSASAGEKIEKAEAPYFRAIGNIGSDDFVSRHVKAFSIVTLSFKPGQKWRLSDGGAARMVTMSDADFQAKVDSSQVSFAKGDILVCDVVETARRTAEGFKSDYEIKRVIEHRHPDQQTNFSWPSRGGEGGGEPSA